MKEQLVKLMQHYGLNATRLADEIGVQRSGISHILSERNQPSFDFLNRIKNRYPDINGDWLITGKGEMISGNPAYKKIEPDLFSSIENVNKKEIKYSDNSSEHEKINITEKNETHKSEVTNVTSIEKLIILYNDGTFIEYKPKIS